MSHIKAEMYKIRFPLGSAPDPAAGRGGKRRGREGREGECPSPKYFGLEPPLDITTFTMYLYLAVACREVIQSR